MVLGLGGLLLMTGCVGTTTEIATFGESTHALTGKIDRVIDSYNTTALEREFTDLASLYSDSHTKDLTREALLEIRKPITPKQKKNFALYRANQALGEYAQALRALSVAGSQGELDMAMADLYGSMKDLNSHYKTLKKSKTPLFEPEDFALSTKLVTALGSLLLQERRNTMIKHIVIEADPKIATICKEITRQLHTSGIGEGIAVAKQYIFTEELIDYHSHTESTLDWRRDKIKRLYQLRREIATSTLLIQEAQKAIKTIQETHHLLAKELQANRFTSHAITQAMRRLKTLNKHYNNFEKLLLECKKISQNKEGVVSCNDPV